MVQSHTRRNSHKRAATKNPASRLRSLQTLRPAGHPPTPPHGMRRRDRDVGMDKATPSIDAAVRSESNTYRMAPSPSAQILAPQKTPGYPVDPSKLRTYRMQQQRTLTPHDYLDFIRRAKWKATGRTARVENYLAFL